MNETFLVYLDKLYNKARETNCIQENNLEYRHYEKLIPLDFISENAFLCLKQKKTKILFCQSNVKVYLSDADIINTIVSLDNGTAKFLLNEFIDLYKGQYNKFKFKIKNQIFEGQGIKYKDKDINFLLYTDNNININEFIFILNMIFEKDRLASALAEKDLLKYTLCKFIALIGYYKLKQGKYSTFLQKIKYPIEKNVNDVFNSPANIVRNNQLFMELQLFEKNIIA